MKSTISCILVLFFITQSFSQNIADKDSLQSVIHNYHQGFFTRNHDLTRSAISNQLNMFNGNHSINSEDWQAHMFLIGDQIDEWISFMILKAGPFKNNIKFKMQHVRSNSAIIVTEENGANKFRSWEREKVVYQLGNINGNWKILSVFIKNLKNPE